MVLKGLKVVDFSAYIAGPGAAGMLSDWGADVIKVERPGGDAMRYAFRLRRSRTHANSARRRRRCGRTTARRRGGAGLFVDIDGAYCSPAPPVRFPDATVTRRPPAPRLGQHTRDVLSSANYDSAAIDRLIAEGAAA